MKCILFKIISEIVIGLFYHLSTVFEMKDI